MKSVFLVFSKTPNHIVFLVSAFTATRTYSGRPPQFTKV